MEGVGAPRSPFLMICSYTCNVRRRGRHANELPLLLPHEASAELLVQPEESKCGERRRAPAGAALIFSRALRCVCMSLIAGHGVTCSAHLLVP